MSTLEFILILCLTSGGSFYVGNRVRCFEKRHIERLQKYADLRKTNAPR